MVIPQWLNFCLLVGSMGRRGIPTRTYNERERWPLRLSSIDAQNRIATFLQIVRGALLHILQVRALILCPMKLWSVIICSEMPQLLSHPKGAKYLYRKTRQDYRHCGVKFGKRRMCQHKICFAFALFLNGRQTDTSRVLRRRTQNSDRSCTLS
jgi:hypothetical protein